MATSVQHERGVADNTDRAYSERSSVLSMANERPPTASDDSLEDASGGYVTLLLGICAQTIADDIRIKKNTGNQLAKLDNIKALDQSTQAKEDLAKTLDKIKQLEDEKKGQP